MPDLSFNLAVVGATGAVGREMLAILAERGFPLGETHALASRRSLGVEVSFGDGVLKIADLDSFDFSAVDIALFAAGSDVSRLHAPRAAKAGAMVIDNASLFRMEADVPLIVPEVNADILKRGAPRNIIANPNCSTAQLVVALKPLHDMARIRRVVVSTYQAVSGAGKAAMDELWEQTRSVFTNGDADPQAFTRRIAFNVIPCIGGFMPDGAAQEEWKMVVETKKILDPAIEVLATCVRVPVFMCHSEAVAIEFEKPISAADARETLREAPGCLVIDDPDGDAYVTPIECAGDYAVFISRLRPDPSVPHGLAMWVVSDNLRKGAALNAVQIAETLISQGLKPRRRAA